VQSVLHHVFEVPANAWQGTDRRWCGYRHRVDLIQPSDRGESLPLGLVAWGGESQLGTVHVELNGQACARLVEWDEIRTWGESAGARITRVDAAHDDFNGVTVNIAQARAWFEGVGFSANGRPPQAELIDDLGSGKGKTLYVGNRAFGKLCRVYEKGKKEGDPASPWCRVEVEWRNKGREIPWDILTRPADYLAGAYPCLRYLSVRQERIRTVRRAAAIQYPRMVEWVKSAAGKALNVIHQVEGGDANAVLMQVLREGAPKRLEPFTSWPGMLEEVAHADPDAE
jgi:phage replication initiation protein